MTSKFFLVTVCFLLFGCKRETNVNKPPSFEDEAKNEMTRYETNVIGWRRTLSSDLFAIDDKPTNWNGRAVVEFINTAGGVETTNIKFHFCFWTNDFSKEKCVMLDYEPWAKEESEQKAKEFEEWKKNIER